MIFREKNAKDDLQEGLPRELLFFHLPMTQTAVNVFQISETGPVVDVAGTGDYFDLKNS